MAQARPKSATSTAQKRNPLVGRRGRGRTNGVTATPRRPSPGARRARAKFLHYFPKGFYDPEYQDLERNYKWQAHQRWQTMLGVAEYRKLLHAGKYGEIAARAVAIEARTNLLFSFEKMALRDAVKSPIGARAFARGLYDFLHGPSDLEMRFERWCAVVAGLPRRQTRVLTWPVVTVMGFIAQPETHFFLKPTVTRKAADQYGRPLPYQSRPSWATYSSLLAFARTVRRDLRDLRPRDMIDIQSFLWIQGSDEYP